METKHTTIAVDGITVRIDELNGHIGFGYQINGRAYTDAGFSSVSVAKRAARRHVKRTIKNIERGRELNKLRMREMRTIRSW